MLSMSRGIFLFLGDELLEEEGGFQTRPDGFA